MRVFGLSTRAFEEAHAPLVARVKAAQPRAFPPAVQADLPDWLWERLVAEQGEAEAMAIAQGLLGAAPLDLRSNLARRSRDEVLSGLALEAAPTPYSPAGIRLKAKPPINRASTGFTFGPTPGRVEMSA